MKNFHEQNALHRLAEVLAEAFGRGFQRGFFGARASHAPTATPPSTGQEVRYRQGRGDFAARVVALNGSRVVLERLMDGKRIERPLKKVYVA